MSFVEKYDVIINKITKPLYEEYVGLGIITPTMVEEQAWLFVDDQFLSLDNFNKLLGIEANAQVNIIEGVQVNGVDLYPNAKKVNIVLPTKTSDLTNDSGFIDNTISNLQNYYTKTEVNGLINNISTLSMQVVSALPSSDISSTTIYLTLKSIGLSQNIYNEYIYVNGSWELIGDTQLDLTNYALKTEIPTKLSDLTNDLNLTAYENKIEEIKVNGSVITPTNKSVNITLPSCEEGAECNTIEVIKLNGTALVPDENKAVNIQFVCKTRIWS